MKSQSDLKWDLLAAAAIVSRDAWRRLITHSDALVRELALAQSVIFTSALKRPRRKLRPASTIDESIRKTRRSRQL
jgi:hypothetical protein